MDPSALSGSAVYTMGNFPQPFAHSRGPRQKESRASIERELAVFSPLDMLRAIFAGGRMHG
jgi:hypothetical protein